ncbi:MAG: glycoside hydrolase family 5 protein [Anaerolineae bacterium]|nr:glycoside hydrolase family 5 protein [Anaerolineae bacterium]
MILRRLVYIFLISVLLLIGITGSPAQADDLDKMTLWNSGTTQLRGADFFQRIRYEEVDGPDFLGSDYIGPPATQADFDQLAGLGANYVNLSIPGIYHIEPPYNLDVDAQANLDSLLDMVKNANMFAVISFRTGPGRSDFTFYPDVLPPENSDLLIETVWTEQAAQDAWVAMWRHTAERYEGNPVVAGYDLMVEPNSSGLLEIYDPVEFANLYGGSLYDWKQLEPRLIDAVRDFDDDTPILLSNNGWNGLYWLSDTYISADPRVVYTAHNYEPFTYSNQWYDSPMLTYPGTFDADGDGNSEVVNKAWQENWYADTLDVFLQAHDVPVAINELGVTRWSPGAATYLADQISIIESSGLNHAIWMFHSNWQPFKDGDNAFDFLLGPNPSNTYNVSSSALLTVIKQNWAKNTIRPFPVTDLSESPLRNYYTSSPVTLTWSRVSYATGYWIQVADNPSFLNLIYDNQNLSSSSLTFPAALGNGIYYWRVRAKLANGVHWGNWSASDSFRVAL